jgi:hypothetical protein
MARAWPFENKPEAGGAAAKFRDPSDFVAVRSGCEAVVVRIGAHDAQVVVVDSDGAWERWVYHSIGDALEAANALGVPVHNGEYPEGLRVRMNARQRPAREYRDAAYPEQGRVGPLMPYPENRPRRIAGPEGEREETPDGASSTATG